MENTASIKVFLISLKPDSKRGSGGPVTLGSDYRTLLKSDPILLILKSKLDVPILKIDKFAVTLYTIHRSRFYGSKNASKNMSCDFSKIGTDLRTGSQISTDFFLVGSDFVFGLKIGSGDRTIGEKIGSDLPILKSCDSRVLV